MVNLETRLRRGVALVKLADLLSVEGWEALCVELGLQGEEADRDNVRNKPGILLPKISHTRLMGRVLSEHGSAISMLSEVIGFLVRYGTAARTTGIIATLPGLEDLKPQHREMMGEWNKAALKRLGGGEKLEAMWTAASTALDELLARATTHCIGSWRPSRYGDFFQRREDETTYHYDVVDMLERLIKLIRDSLPSIDNAAFIKGVIQKCDDIAEACVELTVNHRAGHGSLGVYEEQEDKVTIFVEQMRINATMLANIDDVASLIELSVFRNLPQLFEVWLLCFILQTLGDAGYPITLENIGLKGRPDVWNLRYTGAKSPIAKIGSDAWVFFQYKANGGSTMPDFAIYDNKTASGLALIVLDAKFSEKCGYSAADYRATLAKYQSLSTHRFTVEYMDRTDIVREDGMMFGVRPDAPALEKLKHALFEALVTPTRQALAVIDCSQSFADRLPHALTTIKPWADDGRLKDQFVLFAKEAELFRGLAKHINGSTIRLPNDNATRVEALKALLADLSAAAGPLDILLVSDGEFEEGGLDILRAATNRMWTLGTA